MPGSIAPRFLELGPTMDPGLLVEVDRLFDLARALPAAECRAFLDRHCTDNPGLRSEVEFMLRMQEEGEPGERPPAQPVTVAISESASRRVTRGDIGPYRILETLGAGGFGEVFLAEQVRPVRRRVALKIVKPGMDSREIITRFEAERQALALMDHPNIARVFDSGTTEDGRPYFVMEWVAGAAIHSYCAQHKLDLHRRLDLFRQVCMAVQHAHQKGIIHRDLKPSNILVTQIDGKAAPKVIDFGIAKALGSQLVDQTLITCQGHVVGTPAYMSPEQAGLPGAAVDTRSDIYALGVILYELLTDRLPYAVTGELRAVMERIINEAPARPASANERIDADAETIVLKCLAKEPGRRYQSAGELARDIDHYLAGEPIEARRDSGWYVLRKMLRKHRVPVAAAAIVSATVGVSAVALLFMYTRQGKLLADVRRERDQGMQMLAFLEATLASSDPLDAMVKSRTRGTVTLRSVVDAANEKLESELRVEPEVEATLRYTLGSTYWGLGAYREAEKQLRQALAIRQQRHSSPHSGIATAQATLGKILMTISNYPEAEELLSEAIRALRIVPGDHRKPLCEAMVNYAWVQIDSSDFSDVEPMLEEAIQLARDVYGPNSLPAARALLTRGFFHNRQNQFSEAEKVFREILVSLTNSYGPEHLDVATVLGALGNNLRNVQRLDEAESALKRALDIYVKTLGSDHPLVAHFQDEIGLVKLDKQEFAEAEQYFRKALDHFRRTLDPENLEHAFLDCNLGLALLAQGKAAEAAGLFQEALRIREAKLEPTNGYIGSARVLLGAALAAQGEFSRAEELMINGYGQMERDSSQRPVTRHRAIQLIVKMYESSGRPDAAKAWAEKLLSTEIDASLRSETSLPPSIRSEP